MDTWYDLADAGLDTRLLPQISDIFSSFSNDDAGVLCADERAKSESVMGGRGGRAGLGRRGLIFFCKRRKEKKKKKRTNDFRVWSRRRAWWKGGVGGRKEKKRGWQRRVERKRINKKK